MNKEGFLCCLGFATKQLGNLKDNEILGEVQPDDTRCVMKTLTKRRRGEVHNTKFSQDCININDDSEISREQREGELIKRFKAKQIALQFTGTYTEPKEEADGYIGDTVLPGVETWSLILDSIRINT